MTKLTSDTRAPALRCAYSVLSLKMRRQRGYRLDDRSDAGDVHTRGGAYLQLWASPRCLARSKRSGQFSRSPAPAPPILEACSSSTSREPVRELACWLEPTRQPISLA